MPTGRLSRSFRPHGNEAAVEDGEALEALLEAATSAAKSRWPELEVSAEELASYAGARALRRATLEQIEALRWDDLLIACACVRGERAALLVFERMVAAAARIATQSFPVTDLELELRQELWLRLLVKTSAEDRPRLLDYAGRGPLAAWLRVTAARAAFNMVRGKVPSVDVAQALADRSETIDLELRFVQLTYRDQFISCFREAFASLEPRARTLLRWHLVDDVGLEAIARHYRVNRSSVTRWISQARDQMVERTIQGLHQKVGASGAELDSLVRALRNNLDASISQLLPKAERPLGEDSPSDTPA